MVFGRVLRGKNVVRKVEAVETSSGDRPKEDVKIVECGQLEEGSEEVKSGRYGIEEDGTGDVYEDFPEDQSDQLETDVQATFDIASSLKSIANTQFSKGSFAIALEKYEKALRYLQLHPILPESTPPTLASQWTTLKTSIQLNTSLCALKLTPPQPSTTIKHATAVIQHLSTTPDGWESDKEAEAKKKADLAKAFYRRALGYVAKKDDERAEKDLERARELAPGDAGIKAELANVAKRREARKKAQRAAYSKMFS